MLLRPAEPADAMGVARVHVRAWQVAYRKDVVWGIQVEDQRYRRVL